MPQALVNFWNSLSRQFYLNFIKDNRWRYLTKGLKNTLLITAISLVIGIVIGIIVAVVRSSYLKNYDQMPRSFKKTALGFANTLCSIYLTIIRGTPAVVQLMIMYFIIFAGSDNPLLVASLTFGINSGAYVAEIFRSGIMSVEAGQMEAGRSLGFNFIQTMWYIVIPQAFKNVLPALGNEFITLLKETSVAGYVGVWDLTKGGDIIRSRTYSAFMPLIAVAVTYLILVIILTKLVGLLEKKLRNSDH